MKTPHGTRPLVSARSLLRRALAPVAALMAFNIAGTPGKRHGMRSRATRSDSREAGRYTWLTMRGDRRWAALIALAFFAASIGGPRAQAPVGAGFNLNAADLRFILQQIKIAENHAAGGTLLGSGPNQVGDPKLPYGLRTVDGTFNNLISGQQDFGAADRLFPRMAPPTFRPAEPHTFDPDGPGPLQVGSPSSYAQKKGAVSDTHPRLASNLIVDQTASNPSALAAAGPNPEIDSASGTLFIPNVAPDVGLSARTTRSSPSSGSSSITASTW